jgi:putative ABC transport system permease protein
MLGLYKLFLENNFFLKLSIKELRGSFNEFKIVITSIFIGVFIITAVGSLSQNLKYKIDNKRSELLGGTYELSTTYQEFPRDIKNWLEENGEVSQIVEMRTMLSSLKSLPYKRRIVELKAVDENWPLIGEIKIKSEKKTSSTIKINEHIDKVFIDKGLKKQLNISIGDTVKLGNIKVKVEGIIIKEPDRMFSFATFGSRVIVSSQTLKNTGLVIPGSLVKYKLKFIPNDKKLELSYLNKLIEGTNVSLKNIQNSTNNFNTFIERTTLFISLVGLITLLISGVGISNGVKGYLIKKIKNIAILKSLGAKNTQVFKIYLFQMLFIFLMGIIPALIFGISIPFLFSSLIGDKLFSSFQAKIFIEPIFISCSFGFVVCLLFTIIPLSKTYEIKPIHLIRISRDKIYNEYSNKIKIFIVFLICCLCFLTINLTSDIKLAFYIFVSLFISLIMLTLSTNFFFMILKKISFKVGTIKETIRKSIVDRNTFSKSIVISFSIGLSLLITLNIVQESLDRKIYNTINQEAPDHFFIDIQPSQIEDIKRIAINSIGTNNLNAQPMLRGRIIKLNNVNVENLKVDKEVQWVLRRDRAFTWGNTKPKNNKLISGEWWNSDYNGPLLVSIGDKIAKGLNLKIGDKIEFNILGRNFVAKIHNTREIIWENMGINFIFFLSDSKIKNAPHTWIATSKNQNKVLSADFVEKVVSKFSNISSISVEESYKAIRSLLKLLIIIINTIAFVTLISGIIVLNSILDVSKKDKLYEVAVFKILGANPKKIISLWFCEYMTIGFLSSLISILIGCSVSYILLNYLFNIEFYLNYITLIFFSLILPIFITIFSLLKMLNLIYSKPLKVLRAHY